MSISGIRGADCIQCPQLKKNIFNRNRHVKKIKNIVEDVSSKDHITASKHLERTCHNIVTTYSSR